jgi:hypothetical protein
MTRLDARHGRTAVRDAIDVNGNWKLLGSLGLLHERWGVVMHLKLSAHPANQSPETDTGTRLSVVDPLPNCPSAL